MAAKSYSVHMDERTMERIISLRGPVFQATDLVLNKSQLFRLALRIGLAHLEEGDIKGEVERPTVSYEPEEPTTD
jgi:hypothetical protein